MKEKEILEAILKALHPIDAGDLTDCTIFGEFDPTAENPSIDAYDLYENCALKHYKLVHNQEMPEELPIEDYIGSLNL